MKIDEAIRVFGVLKGAPVLKEDSKCVDALQLGIESLKVVKLGLAGLTADITLFKKGETEE